MKEWMANKNMKRCSALFDFHEMQTENTRRQHYKLLEWFKNTPEMPTTGEHVDQLTSSYTGIQL